MTRITLPALVLAGLLPATASAQSDAVPDSPYRRETTNDVHIELQLRFGLDPVLVDDRLPAGMTPRRSHDRARLLSTFRLVVAGEMTLNGVRYGADGAPIGAAYWWVEMEDDIPVRSSDLRPGRHAVELGYWLADDSAVARSGGARITHGAEIAARTSGREWNFDFSSDGVTVKGRCHLADAPLRPEVPPRRVRTAWRAGHRAQVFHVLAYEGGEHGTCDPRELTVHGDGELARALRAASDRHDVQITAKTGWRMAGGSSYGFPRMGCDDEDTGGIVRGTIRFDGAPDAEARVWLDGPVLCHTESDSTGAFSFRNVSPGRYDVAAGSGFRTRHVDPVVVHVVEDSATVVDFTLEPADIEADCRDLPFCSPFLEPVPAERLPPDIDPLQAAGLRTGIAIALATRYGHEDSVVCLDDASDSLLGELRRLAPLAVSGDECGLLGRGLSELLRHMPTGRRAFRVGFRILERHPGWAVGSVGIGHGRQASIGRRCIYVMTPSGWRLGSCRRTWIS